MLDFNDSKAAHMPGYTGHRQADYVEDVSVGQSGPGEKRIPGYGGHIPGIQAENMFGKTYGKLSKAPVEKGIDLPPEKKFRSMQQEEFVNQKKVSDFEPAAKIVGVDKQPDTYKRPLDPSLANKLWGTEDRDEVVEKVHFEKSKQAFYGVRP